MVQKITGYISEMFGHNSQVQLPGAEEGISYL